MGGINAASTATANNKNTLFKIGQKYSEIKDERLKPIFEDLDLNGDKELSKNEIDAFKNYLKLKDENFKKHKQFEEAKWNANTPRFAGGISGFIGGIAGIITGNKIMKGIYNTTNGSPNWFNKTFFKEVVTKHFATGDSKNYCKGDYIYSTSEIVGTPLKKAIVWGGGILAAGLAGYGIYKLVSKLTSVKEGKQEKEKLSTELEKEDAQIKKLDAQYKNINIQQESLQKINEQKSDDYTMEDALETIGYTNIIFMMMDDDLKRQKAEEEKYEEYYKNNIEQSRYNREHNISTNWADEKVRDTSQGG